MGKNQLIALSVSIAAILVFYLGCDNLSESQQEINQTRSKNLQVTDIQNLLNEARASMSETSLGEISVMESLLRTNQKDTTAMIETLEKLSATWFQNGRADIAGHYAKVIAEINNDAQSWEITGTTFILCLQKTQEKKIRQFCSQNAVTAFENAVAEDPDNIAHRINLALCYVEEPQADNPMRGILMLRDLQEKNPNNPAVLYQLGRLAVMTGQYQKAIERLEAAFELNSEDKRISCLLSESYKQIGDLTKSNDFAKKCNN